MDKIILGLLMIQRLTLYEIRTKVKKNLWCICSDSTGSIQAALKKLLAAGMIVCSEYVERSVNKKRYAITEKGRQAFMSWVQTPAHMASAVNMELSKLLFMGIVPSTKRDALIDETIAKLEEERASHIELYNTINKTMPVLKGRLESFWSIDQRYRAGVQNAMQNTNDTDNLRDIMHFQMMTLRYAIDAMQFDIEWYKKLKSVENIG